MLWFKWLNPSIRVKLCLCYLIWCKNFCETELFSGPLSRGRLCIVAAFYKLINTHKVNFLPNRTQLTQKAAPSIPRRTIRNEPSLFPLISLDFLLRGLLPGMKTRFVPLFIEKLVRASCISRRCNESYHRSTWRPQPLSLHAILNPLSQGAVLIPSGNVCQGKYIFTQTIKSRWSLPIRFPYGSSYF